MSKKSNKSKMSNSGGGGSSSRRIPKIRRMLSTGSGQSYDGNRSKSSWGLSMASLGGLSSEELKSMKSSSSSALSDDESSTSDNNSAALFAADADELTADRSKKDESSNSNTGSFPLADKQAAKSSRVIYITVAFLVAAAILVGSLVHHVAKKNDQEEYKSAFQTTAKDIADSTMEKIKQFSSTIRSVSVTMTSAAVGSEATWPFYTMDNLAVVAKDFLDYDSSVRLIYSPLVSDNDRAEWEEYSVIHQNRVIQPTYPYTTPEFIYSRYNGTTELIPDLEGTGPYSPIWQMQPLPNDYITISYVNFNMLSDSLLEKPIEAAYSSRQRVLTELEHEKQLFGIQPSGKDIYLEQRPQSLLLEQVVDGFGGSNQSSVVGHFFATVPWDLYFKDVLAEGSKSKVYCVIANSCGPTAYTYQVDASSDTYLGKGDLHDTATESPNLHLVLDTYGNKDDNTETTWSCTLDLTIYPTAEMEWNYNSSTPVLLFLLVLVAFLLVGVAVMTNHRNTETQRREMFIKTQRSKAIIASLFPDAIREKLFDIDGEVKVDSKGFLNKDAAKAVALEKESKYGGGGGDSWLFGGGAGGGEDPVAGPNKTTADLYLECTVCYSDICGFTAWSSSREPEQVFTLLETIFRSFDKIAKDRGAFKVETVGDSYVAVAGLPKARDDHAIVMARFARDAIERFIEVSKMLEITLGPDTSDLGIRFGLHSGPITAGVLRGERARFQLFGDTVNMCQVIETSGERDRIHISKETAELIKAGGRANWVKLRQIKAGDKRNSKGPKETYWLLPKSAPRNFAAGANASSDNLELETRIETAPSLRRVTVVDTQKPRDSGADVSQELKPAARRKSQSRADKMERLIFWNAESLLQLLRQIVARRNATKKERGDNEELRRLEDDFVDSKLVLNEVREIIELPGYVNVGEVDPSKIDLGVKVETQLRDYITILASFYRPNPFHNFEHASHVTMSTKKLLSRIVAPKIELDDGSIRDMNAKVHDTTYGITSDPLTQFSVLLAALIHDVDHRGVGNHDLSKEDATMAAMFENKSIAEQNSMDIAWESLMDPSFRELRDCIYADEEELVRFRSLLVNSVLATDIFDKDLGALRKRRWEKAFSIPDHMANEEDVNRKATIVIEHLIQASDVSHTMQHWHVYLKWNEKLFHELYLAYKVGRTEKDPSAGWYKGEIWFYDNYVIPLAKKLENCGVFGVSSDEYLNYAVANRNEWEAKGEEIVAKMVEKYSALYPDQEEEITFRDMGASSDSDEKTVSTAEKTAITVDV